MQSAGFDLRAMGSASSVVCLGAMMFSAPGSQTSIEWGAGGLLAFGLSRLVPRRRPVAAPPKPARIETPEQLPAQPVLVRIPTGSQVEIDAALAGTHPALRAAVRTSVRGSVPQ